MTQSGDVLRETTWYLYGFGTGNPTAIVTKPANSTTYAARQLSYTQQGEVWMIQRYTWQPSGSSCVNQTIPSVVEIRGTGRARQMVRRRNMIVGGGYGTIVPGTNVWTDYDGDSVYGDYVPNFATNGSYTGITNTVQYLPGIAEKRASGTPSTVYYHSDQIGSLRVTTLSFPATSRQSISRPRAHPLRPFRRPDSASQTPDFSPISRPPLPLQQFTLRAKR